MFFKRKNEKEMNVDKRELAKQIKERYMSANEYVRVEIVIPTSEKYENEEPFVCVECQNSTKQDMAYLIHIIRVLLDRLIKENPEQAFIEELISNIPDDIENLDEVTLKDIFENSKKKKKGKK